MYASDKNCQCRDNKRECLVFTGAVGASVRRDLCESVGSPRRVCVCLFRASGMTGVFLSKVWACGGGGGGGFKQPGIHLVDTKSDLFLLTD